MLQTGATALGIDKPNATIIQGQTSLFKGGKQ